MPTIVMTGATQGIGAVAARTLLADARNDLVVLTRRGSVAELIGMPEARSRITEVSCDLADLADVARAAAQIEGPIDLVLGNAGIQNQTAASVSKDGFEETFAVNVLANHQLLRGVRHALVPGARIVLVGSDVHDRDHFSAGLVPTPVWTSPEKLATAGPSSGVAGRRAYATSKLALVHLVHAWAAELGDRAEIFTYNPGLVPDTGLTRGVGSLGRAVAGAVASLLIRRGRAMRAQPAGELMARTLLDRPAAPSGSYINKGVVKPSSQESYDPGREAALWAFAEEVCSAR